MSLPDILETGLSVVFCGINPGIQAAAMGHHFAGRGNRFWRVLHLAGFTPDLLTPDKDRTLLQYGCGSTVAVARPTAQADQLSRVEIKEAAAELEKKIEYFAPRYVAFLGKMAFAEIRGTRDIPWGLQATTFGDAQVWLLPNPSGLNRSFSLDALVAEYRALYVAAHPQTEAARFCATFR